MLLESSIFTFLRVRVTGFLPMGSLVEECWTPQELTGIRMNLQPSMSWFEAVRHSHQPKTEPTNVYRYYRYTVYIYINVCNCMQVDTTVYHVPCTQQKSLYWSYNVHQLRSHFGAHKVNPLTPPKDTLATCSQAAASLTYGKKTRRNWVVLAVSSCTWHHPSNDSWLSCMTLVIMVEHKQHQQTWFMNSWCFPYHLCIISIVTGKWIVDNVQEIWFFAKRRTLKNEIKDVFVFLSYSFSFGRSMD